MIPNHVYEHPTDPLTNDVCNSMCARLLRGTSAWSRSGSRGPRPGTMRKLRPPRAQPEHIFYPLFTSLLTRLPSFTFPAFLFHLLLRYVFSYHPHLVAAASYTSDRRERTSRDQVHLPLSTPRHPVPPLSLPSGQPHLPYLFIVTLVARPRLLYHPCAMPRLHLPSLCNAPKVFKDLYNARIFYNQRRQYLRSQVCSILDCDVTF